MFFFLYFDVETKSYHLHEQEGGEVCNLNLLHSDVWGCVYFSIWKGEGWVNSDGNDKEFVSMSCEFINQVYVYVISSKPFSNLLLFRL